MKNKLLICILLISFLDLKAQNNNTTFGLQYKPIIPAKYFNSSRVDKSFGEYNFNLIPKYSNAFGMILRHQINKTFSLEYGLNYIQRNYKLTIMNYEQDINDFTVFGMRSYEIPIQLLTYVRVSEFWYLNVTFGISHNVLASNIISYGEIDTFSQKTKRKEGGYRALLANIGMEYRTENNGRYYIGTSLHSSFTEIGRLEPQYNDLNNSFNYQEAEKLFFEIPGNFITIDFRYFFAE